MPFAYLLYFASKLYFSFTSVPRSVTAHLVEIGIYLTVLATSFTVLIHKGKRKMHQQQAQVVVIQNKILQQHEIALFVTAIYG